MTTMMLDNPLVDFSRADFSSFAVPSPVRAAVTDSYIEENRRGTPQSAINQRRTERLTVSELNDMDMDEIVKRAYMVPIDTRGPVTRFLDLIDLPRNALFNLAAGDTARRKQGMGDTAALGLPRVNTSDVLESLGVRPGLVTGIAGFVGDVALDPLTYIGPAGWATQLTGKGGRTASLVAKGGKVLNKTVDEIKTGANISDNLVRDYLEKSGYTAEKLATATNKEELAREISEVLSRSEQGKINKLLSWIGGDVEYKPVLGRGELPKDIAGPVIQRNSLADDITGYIAPDADDVTKARITAAKEFYKAYGRPFSPGVRVVKDPASKIGFSFTTSKSAPKESAIFHVPFTSYELSVPAFTPAALQQVKVAGLVKNAMASGEYFSSPEMKRVIDADDIISDAFRTYQDIVSGTSKPPEASVVDVAGTTKPIDETVSDVAPEVADEVTRVEALNNLRGTIRSTLEDVKSTIEKIQADPNASYADLLYAQDMARKSESQALVIEKQERNLRRTIEQGQEFSAQIRLDAKKKVTNKLEELRVAAKEENVVRQERLERLRTKEQELIEAQELADQEAARTNPASPLPPDNPLSAIKAKYEKQRLSFAVTPDNADPAANSAVANRNDWYEYRTAAPGSEKHQQAVAKIATKEVVEQDPNIVNQIEPLPEIVTDEQFEAWSNAMKSAETRRVVAMDEAETSAMLADKDSQAFTYFQQTAYYKGVARGTLEQIDLNKVNVGDRWQLGSPDFIHETPLQIEVVGITEDGLVQIKVEMPRLRQKKTKWFERTTKAEQERMFAEMRGKPNEYYLLDPNQAFAVATKRKGNQPTVVRMVETEGAQAFTGNISELRNTPKFSSKVDKVRLAENVRNNILEKFDAGKISKEVRDSSLQKNGDRIEASITSMAKQIHRMTRDDVPDIDVNQIRDVIVDVVNNHRDISKLSDDDIIGAVRVNLFAEPVPPKFRQEAFGRKLMNKADIRTEAMRQLRIAPEDLGGVKVGDNTEFAGMTESQIRQTVAQRDIDESMRQIRFQKHRDVEGAYNAEMGEIESAYEASVKQQQELAAEVDKQLQRRLARKINEIENESARKLADVGMDKNAVEAERAARQQRLDQAEGEAVKEILRDLGANEDALDPIQVGKGTEYEGMSIDDIRNEVFKKHSLEHDKKFGMTDLPKYYTTQEIEELTARADYLNAKATAAAEVSNASGKPLLAAAGSDVEEAFTNARVAMGLGADDMGSGVMASLSTMTEKFASRGKAGAAIHHAARNLERTFVNRLGLAPGMANDVIKRYIRAQDISQTAAFRLSMQDMIQTIANSDIRPDQHNEAAQLALALMFVGDKTIDEMTKMAGRDRAYKIVIDAMKGGLLDPTVNPNGSKTIRELSAKYKQILDNLDVQSGVPDYVPNVLTPQAQNFINFQRANQANLISSKKAVAKGEVESAAAKFVESFQKPRSTIEHAWSDLVGNQYTLMESEMAYKDYGGEYIQQLKMSKNEDERRLGEYIERVQNKINAWESLTEVQRQGADTYYLSPHEINRRVKEDGMFGTLTNKALNGKDFMYADIVNAVSMRLGGEERMRAQKLLQQYVAPYELRVNSVKLQGSGLAGGGGKKFTTTNGTEVELVNDKGEYVIYIGNTRYRQPKISVSDEFSIANSLYRNSDGTLINNAFYPEKIADIIEDAAGFFGKPKEGSGFAKAFGINSSAEDNITGIVKAAEKISGYWKIFTLLHPSWTVNDIVGNLFLIANMGINPMRIVRKAKDTFQFTQAVARGDVEALKEMTIEGKTGLEHLASQLGSIIDTAGHAETSRQLRNTGEYVDPYAYSMIRAMKKLAKGDVQGARAEMAGAYQETVAAAKQSVAETKAVSPEMTGEKARVVIDAAFDKTLVRRVWQGWAHVNGLANNWLKVSAYFCLLEDGYDAASAARMIGEKMLDMTAVTSTDRNLRRVMPFYNWMKHSGVLGVREFFRNPKFFAVAPKVKQALEESFNGEENLPENARPSWIRDQLAFQIGTDPDTRRALTLTSSLPTEAATYAISFLASPFLGWGAFQDSLAYVTNALNPVPKSILELGARKEFFTKRTISSEGGDITPTEYLLSQVRPFRELGIGSLRGGPLIRAFEDDPVLGLSRLAIGGRLQPFEEERRVQNLQREYDERVDALRRRIGVAERESQKDESLRKRIELLRLFNQMKGLGLTVPKWASRQIEQVNQAQGAT